MNVDKDFKISSWAIDNKMTVYVIIAIIMVGGILSYYAMPRESFPEVIETKVYVSSINPGNSAEDVEKFITEPLEEAFNNIGGVKEITSSTFQDYSMVIVEFDDEIEIEVAKQKVKDKVDQEKAATTWPTLDNGAKVEPNVFELNISEEMPILNINLTGNYPVQELKDFAEYLQDKIELLPQVKEAAIRGVEEMEVEIAVDPYKMAASEVSFDNIINAVRGENQTISGGNVITGGQEKNIRIIGEIENPRELENVVVKKEDGLVFLRDIAQVHFQEKEPTTFAREWGEPVVMLDIKKRAGTNMIEAIEDIKKLVAAEQESFLPEDLHISFSNDQSTQTENMVNDLVNNIIFGVILVVAVLMFFLGFRNALFVGFAIPMSMLLSFIVLSALGFTLNTMVLFALVMGLGMLVDNGIVVVENVYSLMDQGMSRKEAAKQGVGEIAWPIIASTATTVAAFFPLALWPGIVGKFIIFFPITLSVVLISSLFLALIINSMLTSQFMRTVEKEFSKKKLLRISVLLAGVGLLLLVAGFVMDFAGLRGIGNLLILGAVLMWVYRYFLKGGVDYFQYKALDKLENTYESFLRYALRGKKAYGFFLGTIGILIFSFILVGIFEPKVLFFPENEPNQIITYIEYPEGTGIQKTNALVKKVEQRIYEVIKKYEDDGYNYMVESAIAQVGQGSGNPMTDMGSQNEMPHRGKVTLTMREFKYRRGIRSSDVLSEIREAVQDFPGATITVEKDAAGPPTGYPINMELKGEDYDQMLVEAERLREYINGLSIGGIEALNIDVNKAKPEIDVRVNRVKAGQLGVSSGQVGQTLRRAIFGEEVSTYKEGDDDYEINIRFNEDFRYDENALFNQPITYKSQSSGEIIQVPISSVASKETTSSFSAIKRKDLKRVITLYSNVLTGYNGNEIVERLQTELQNFDLAQGVSLEFTGEQQEQQENMDFLITALLIAMGGILLILVAQFNSISRPIIILIAVFLSFAGVFLGLVIFQMDFIIIMTMMGIISLAGIVVNNAIVLVDYTEILVGRRKKELGLEPDALLSKQEYYELIVAGGKSRLRPVLLTAITTVLGLIPLAVGFNIDFFSLITDYDPAIFIGGDNVIFWGPLAWTVIFGLTFATFLTLVIVPVMYYLVHRGKIRYRARRKE